MDKIYYKELIEKYFDGNITDAEIKKLSDWIKNDRHLQNWWEEEFSKSDAGINPVLRDKLFARIKEQTQGKEETQGKENPRTIRMNPWKWAAAIVLPICIAFFTYYLVDSSQTVGAPFIVKADKGDKATIELPDGTNVVLNSASQLSYLNNFGENGRRVQLNGEAYFKVAHDEKRAFIVQVGDLEVKVLGTSFNVSAYEDAKDVTVVLLEGKVGVYAQKMSHIMKPGDKIEYNKATHKITATQVHPSDYIEWTKGNIYFEKESLENIMKTLSRIYDVEIRFDSNKLPNEYFTGTIPRGGIQNALNILMLTSPFYYEMDGSVIVLKEK
ncbi:FecR family protein [Bacteroides sp. KFT8]|uniref:FecR family protein n=1 Tax=Bacteroides sp. KFT8 TaxID=2025659 RepID=UPI000C055D28|nr:FecR family protein [Bacteroides sp. KFT8]